MAPKIVGDATNCPSSTVSVTKLVGMDRCMLDVSRPGDARAIDIPTLAIGGVALVFNSAYSRCGTVDFGLDCPPGRCVRRSRRCVEATVPPGSADPCRDDRQLAPHCPIDVSYGEPDFAWPADPFWRDKIRIATEAAALGKHVRAGRPASLRSGLAPWTPACSAVAC